MRPLILLFLAFALPEDDAYRFACRLSLPSSVSFGLALRAVFRGHFPATIKLAARRDLPAVGKLVLQACPHARRTLRPRSVPT